MPTSHPETSAKNTEGDTPSAEYRNFENAMRAILRASKADVNQVLAEEKLANAGKPKRGPKPKASSPASGGAD
jgi:hypothetical protein